MTLAELLSILAAAGTLYGLWNQRRYMAAQAAVTFSQADSNNVKDALTLKAEYKADLKDLRAELEVEHTARKSAEDKLEKALEEISELKEKDQKRGDEMSALKKKFDDDTLARDTVIGALTSEVKTLKEAREAERRQWEQERAHYLEGIGLLLGQLVDAKIEPTWLPSGVEMPKQKQKGGLIP